MVASWNRLPNPALVAEDRLEFVTPWAVVADKIRALDIPLEDIDKALYTELVALTRDQVDERLTRLWVTDELEKRKQEIAEMKSKLYKPDTFVPKPSRPTNPNAMYAKRYSHKHPKGYVIDTTKPVHLRFPEADTNEDADKAEKEKEREKKKEKQVNKKTKKIKSRLKATCQWAMAFSVLVGVALAVVLAYHFNNAAKNSNARQT